MDNDFAVENEETQQTDGAVLFIDQSANQELPQVEQELQTEPYPQRNDSEKPKKENRKRNAITVNFSDEEFPDLRSIIDARIDSGLTKNDGHFVRQCIDFAVNHLPGTSFGKPIGSGVNLKDAFYTKQ